MTASGHLAIPTVEPCPFCDYISGRRAYTVLRRGSLTTMLVTREQRGVSHVLVLPTRHAPTLLDLTRDESAELMQEIVLAARAIDAVEQRPGIALWQNNGVPADQTIPHAHFHVAGTLPQGGTDRGHVEELSVAETDRIAARLRPALGP